MTDCWLFQELSLLVSAMIEESRQYYRPTTEGIPETSLTDVILFVLSKFGQHVSIWVPDELTTGADLDLLLVEPGGAIFAFAVQAKKLKTAGEYHKLNSSNSRGYQADLLCSRAPFFPLYLFYNFQCVGLPRGCAIANGHAIRNLVLPLRGQARDSVPASTVAIYQRRWEVLVCPHRQTGVNVADAVGRLPGLNGAPTRPTPVDLADLPNQHRAMLRAEFPEGEIDTNQGPIVVIWLGENPIERY